MRVSNINEVKNQFEIITNEERIFQSYKSIIVKINNKGHVFLDEIYWNYSNTTSKYRNIFLNETTQETKRKIKDGIYLLINLN